MTTPAPKKKALVASFGSPLPSNPIVESPGGTRAGRIAQLELLKKLLEIKGDPQPTKEDEETFLSGWTRRYYSVLLSEAAGSGPPPVQGHGADASGAAVRNRGRFGATPAGRSLFSPEPAAYGTPGDRDLASAMGRLGFGSPAPGAGAGAAAGTPAGQGIRSREPVPAKELRDTGADYRGNRLPPGIQNEIERQEAAAAAPPTPSRFSGVYSRRYGNRGGTRRRHRKSKKHATYKQQQKSKKSTSHRRRSHTRASRRRARGAK